MIIVGEFGVQSTEGIGDELGQLSRPQVGGQDPVFWYLVCIDVLQFLNCSLSLRGLSATDQNPVRDEQIMDGCTLSKKLRV
jgi:hypothetical protein